NNLPNEIPTHYNFAGEVDDWGPKWFIWTLPITGLVIWIGISIMEKFPHTFNYIKISKDTIEEQYKNAVLMMNILKNECIILFSYLSWEMIQGAYGVNSNLNNWIT